MVGSLRYESGGPFHRVENFGTSFFEHGGGSVFRVLQYLRLMGLQHAIPIRYSDLPQAHPRIEQMPAWPLKGAVAPVDGVVVVKLGEPTYRQAAAPGTRAQSPAAVERRAGGVEVQHPVILGCYARLSQSGSATPFCWFSQRAMVKRTSESRLR